MVVQNSTHRQPIRTNLQEVPPGCHRVCAHVRRAGRDSRPIPVCAYIRCRDVIEFSRFTGTAIAPATDGQ